VSSAPPQRRRPDADRGRSRFVDHDRIVGHGRRRLRRDALGIAAAALAAVDPARMLRDLLLLEDDTLHIGGEPVTLAGRDVFVVGAGKATIGMAAVLDELLGARITDGAVVVKRGQARPLRHIEVIESSHPVPDATSLAGGHRLLEIARRASPRDLVLAVVTGGSSSLAVVPAPGISLEEKILVNRLLLASGADIVSINKVRKHISAIKGGLLATACGCEIVNFSVSDVVRDPPDYFTDLTVPDGSTFAMARDVCDRYDLWEKLPRSVAERLRRADPARETPKDIAAVTTFVVASSTMLCAAAAAEAARRGYPTTVLTLELEGEARAAGRWLVDRLNEAGGAAALIAGGENTVTLPGSSVRAGAQAGGPSQEAALAAAVRLADGGPACVLCMDSDGSDGPTDAAGGLVDDLTAGEARERGLDLEAALTSHASHECLRTLGGLVVSGPTGTNVNDLKIALRPSGNTR